MNWLKRLVKGNGHLKNPVTLGQLSKETGIKYMTLYMAVRMGRLDAIWNGRLWLSSVEAVQKAVSEGKMQGAGRLRRK